ncbi:carbohydrate ABC transporter permease [Paenibacillus nasutitermitis]|uniref:Lactose ABC transporter permease n=1 Tax=Paenibacillus nasutitermitis TaxID=1652958 RepID=A0A917DWL4_9BACL|nr:carbohydrate ABC transporter permease [Paenibacillus nasutitermitis]GGD78393.1 lactose ABC transporter permease [Paenibacillus nasutitermitis]
MIRKTLLYLLLIILAFIFISPFLWLASAGLKPNTQDVFSFPPSFIPDPPTFDNFIDAWTSIPFPKYLFNSVMLLLLMIPAHLLITALTAYPLARITFPGRLFFFGAMIGTMFLPEEGKLVPLYILLQKMGMVDSWSGLIFPGLVGGFAILLMRQAYLNIPNELEEAAEMDGCSTFRIWWSIMVPLVRPTIATLSVFSFISVWNSFMWPLIILKNDDLYPLSLGLAYLLGTFGNDIRIMAAGTLISLVPVIVFYLSMQRQFVGGLQGAVKG